MKEISRRIAGYLSALIAFTTVFCGTSLVEAQAATSTTRLEFMYYSNSTIEKTSVVVEKNAQYLYIGDYVNASVNWYDKNDNYYYNYYDYLSLTKGVKYKSSNTKVLTVNAATGQAIAKKSGTATVTVSFKGGKLKINFKVVNSLKSYKKNSNKINSNVNIAAKNLIKIYGKGINASNKYQLVTARGVYYNRRQQFASYPSCYTTVYKYTNGTNNMDKIVIFNPIIRRVEAINNSINAFTRERNPFSSYNSKDVFAAKSISGKGNDIEVKLKKGVTENNIFGIQYVIGENTKVEKLKSVSFPIRVREDKTGLIYSATATVTLDSNIMNVKCKTLKMKSGSKYTLMSSYGDWLAYGKSTFRAR